MNRCCALTKKGERCKIHTCSLQKSYGVDFPVCRFHTTQNVIQKWSLIQPEENTPRDVLGYLDMFWSLSGNMPFIKSVPMVMLTSFTFLQNKKTNTEDYLSLRDNFYDSQFVPTLEKGDCPVCMDRSIDVNTRECGHGYCKECIYTWCDKKGTCPMCRGQIFKIF